MRTVEIIENEINELKEKMISVKGTDTEVYTRIVGYYRSVRNWNKGKRDEYNQRKLFSQPDKRSLKEASDTIVSTTTLVETPQSVSPVKSESIGEPSKYLYFFRTTCPNCPPVKAWLETSGVNGKAINVDEKEGFEAAAKYQIYSSPTVVFLDEEGLEMHRGSSVDALDSLLSAVPV